MNERECNDDPPEEVELIELGRASEQTHGTTGSKFEAFEPKP